MKLKNIITSVAMAMGVCFATSAQTSVTDIRIYINPGHGSWSASCRPMSTVKHGENNAYSDANNDTTNFFESNTNLQKCFGLMEKLIDYGVPFDRTKNQTNSNIHRVGAALDLSQTNIVMSRVKSGAWPAYTDYTNHTENPDTDYYNRYLSVISAEAETWNADMFISVHSNAASNNTTNYLYFAIDGYGSDTAKDNLSKEMSRCGWNHSILDRHQAWTHYDYTMTAADVAAGKGKIGKQELGVLRHSIPGYLVEGYFHTYEPGRHRAMNWDVDHMEGVTYARGVADYYGWTKESTGDIYGIVRDLHEKFTHTHYHGRAGTDDVYKPLNDVVVTLKKDGTEVAKYTTDDEYNGAFVFAGVAPGDYTLEFAHAEYKPCEPVAVTVKAAATSYPKAFLESTSYVPPKINYVNYPDSLLGKDYVLAEAYNVKGEESSLLAEKLAGKTVRRQIIRDNKLYVLALDEANEPYIYLADLKAKTVAELDKAAVVMSANGRMKISDIALTADHVLVAGGVAKVHSSANIANEDSETRGAVNYYKWTTNEETGLPETCELWFSTEYSCNYNRGIMGNTFAYTGTIEDGSIITSCYHGTHTSNIAMRIAQIAILDGAKSSESLVETWDDAIESYFFADALSDNYDFQLMVSPRDKKNFVFDGNKISPLEWALAETGNVPSVLGRNEGIAAKVNGANYFKYAGKDIMVAPAINEDGKITGIKAFDITNGLDKAVEIKINGTEIEAAEYTYASAHGELALDIDTSDRENPVVVGAEIELFLVVDGKTYKYTTAGVDQPAVAGVYAYDLVVKNEESKVTLMFNLTGKASSVDVILTPVAGGDNITYNLGALEAGANTYEIERAKLAGDYNWSVSVKNAANIGIDKLFESNAWEANAEATITGGIAVDMNPESDGFGNTYVSTANKGVYIYNAENELQGDAVWTSQAGTLARGTVSNGKFYVGNNDATNGGILMLDPANPTAVNTVASGNAIVAVSFKGEGETRDMYAIGSYSGASGYQLLKYAGINAADTWTKSPTWVEAADVKLFGSDQDLIACDGGIIISQYREGSSDYAPGFFFISYSGTISNYATSLQATLPGCKKSAIALSKDKSLFAIIDNAAKIQVYDVTWASGVPAFSHKVSIPTNEGITLQMAFDYAGNLHCYNSQAGYCVHATPRSEGYVTTPAKKNSILTKVYDPSAIETIEVNNAPVEYYNLQGVKVNNPANGIFIKKQGSKATKVVL